MVGLSIAESASIMNTSFKGSMASLTVLFFMSSAPCNIYIIQRHPKKEHVPNTVKLSFLSYLKVENTLTLLISPSFLVKKFPQTSIEPL